MSRASRTVSTVMLLAGVLAGQTAIAQPTTLDEVVLLAQSQLRLGRAALIHGHIVVNAPAGVAKVHPQFGVVVVMDQEPQFVANRVEVLPFRREGPWLFDLFVNTILDPRAGLRWTELVSPLGSMLPLLPYPEAVVVTPGAENKKFRVTDGPFDLQPGNYGDLRLFGGATLRLAGGTYNVNSLRVASAAQVYALEPATINVASNVRFFGRSILGSHDTNTNPRCIVLNAATTGTIAFGRFANVEAIINAPAAHLRLGRSGLYSGRFTADRITVGRAAVVKSPLPSEDCP